MISKTEKPDICIVGGGMITQVQILPSLYQLQRLGMVGTISICALDSGPLQRLAQDATLQRAFPGQSFNARPSLDTDPEKKFPDIYRQAIAQMPKHNIVAVAVPDQLHYEVLKTALEHDQHILCVKPLVLQYNQAVEIENLAYEKGLVVGIEYHKRFDYRSLMARKQYRNGRFGEFKLGQAALHECWYYRHSNFQNWCTCENSDMFTYIACHYVDLVHFITGLKPKAVSVYGIKEKYPNGREGYIWTDGRIIWENGACLNVQNALGYPDEGPGGNYQGLRMHCQGDDVGTMIVHNDQFRGVEHAYVNKGTEPGDSIAAQPNPDYFQYVPQGGEGLAPVGYGYRSIEFIIQRICEAISESAGKNETQGLKTRQQLLERFDGEGIMATPKNSSYNELVMEAGRLSILNNSREVEINYGKNAQVNFTKY
ncbi:MAG: Gfo/Idh/MocA family oxidoreductase [Sedimentisphaerales bacterium]|nr:Gfo/Idh/MocA family oxidoreductase [Sedimentisphaerales bacterium]